MCGASSRPPPRNSARDRAWSRGSPSPRVRPQRLVGIGDRHAHHHGGFASPLAAARSCACAADRRFFAPGLAILVMAGVSASTSSAGLSCAQSLEGRLAHHAVAGPAGEFDLRHQLRLQPMHVAGLARRVLAAERDLVSSAAAFSARQDAPDLVLRQSRCRRVRHRPDVRRDGRPTSSERNLPSVVAPAADHHLMPGAAFGLGPVLAAARSDRAQLSLFETMPSSDMRQADCSTASPPASKCST